jgi:hypothetical protein
MVVDVAVLLIGVLALGYCLSQARRSEPAPSRGTALQRSRTVYLVGAAAGCLMIAGALVNLLGG